MTVKLRIQLQVLLPSIADEDDGCVRRLLSEIGRIRGVKEVHLQSGAVAREVCVHFDPESISLEELQKGVASLGAAISARYGHVLWTVDGITHQRKAITVSEALSKLEGVVEAEASAAGYVRIEFDRELVSEHQLLEALSKMQVLTMNDELGKSQQPKAARTSVQRAEDHDHKHPSGEAERSHKHGGLLGANTELIFALSCGAALLAGFLIEKFSTAPGWVPTALFIVAYFFGGSYTLREAIENLRLKRFEIDTLMLVAAAGAAALGSWAEGALLLFLFSLGHALEHYAMGRAKRAIEALADLAPDVATVRRNGQAMEIDVDALEVGDIVLVKPNERLAADGFVVLGSSSVNQAPVTGESIPVDKVPVASAETARARPDSIDASARVFAGTINGSGAMEVEVTRRSSDSALARVVKMVSEAETRKSPTQRLTDKFERIFVPAVLALAGLLLFAWVVVDEPFRDSFYRAMAVLVAASPCALAIATPSAVLSGIARAARGGVLIKGGAPLEELGSLTSIAFDKTGTLTEGRPRITDVLAAEGVAEDELLAIAVAVESLSDHPLAAAIAKDGRDRIGEKVLPIATDLRSLIGQGVTATIEDQTVWIGKAEMFGSGGVPALSESTAASLEGLRQNGRTTMAVRIGDRDLGVIGLLDTARAGAAETLDRLRDMGLKRMIMISGDHQKVADAIAGDVGLDEAIGGLMPDDKVEAVKKLRAQGPIAMVGDGVNDAPAMANATVGVAMGAAGSDVALETADVALMADDLRHLPFAVGLSRTTRRVIRQNVYVSLGIVAFLVPATIFGLGIGPAVAIHEGSTLLVVFNALRLLAYKDRDWAS